MFRKIQNCQNGHRYLARDCQLFIEMRRKTPCFSSGDIRRGLDFEFVLHDTLAPHASAGVIPLIRLDEILHKPVMGW
jgi:hypothetical protein